VRRTWKNKVQTSPITKPGSKQSLFFTLKPAQGCSVRDSIKSQGLQIYTNFIKPLLPKKRIEQPWTSLFEPDIRGETHAWFHIYALHACTLMFEHGNKESIIPGYAARLFYPPATQCAPLFPRPSQCSQPSHPSLRWPVKAQLGIITCRRCALYM